jgi:hypothetical protein
MSASGTKRTSQDAGPFVRFRGAADMRARVGSTASVANDPQQTWAKLKSRSAAVACAMLSLGKHGRNKAVKRRDFIALLGGATD